MMPKELILSSCSGTEVARSGGASRSSSIPAIHLHDLATTAHRQSFKTSSSSVNCLTQIPSANGLGGSVWAVQEGKALVGIWAWQKQHLKLHLPERLSCFTASPNGLWVAGGSSNGQVYLWELVASGLLLASWAAHYRHVTVMRFSDDSSELISGSADASVHVFLISRIVDGETDSSSTSKPYGSLGDHALPITDVAVGKSDSGCAGRCWTASEDGTVKMWSLTPPFDLLSTFLLPPAAVGMSLAVDPAERFLYVGSSAGDVYLIPLFKRPAQMGGAVDPRHGENASATPIRIGSPCINVDAPITSISLSLSATHLLVGTNMGDIHIHSLPSHQHVKTITAHPGPVTHLSTMLSPPDLVGNPSRAEDWPVMEIRNLERTRARKSVKDGQDVGILLQAPCPTVHSLRKRASRRPRCSPNAIHKEKNVVSTDTGSLQSDCRRLRSALEKAAALNDKMWNGVVDLKITETSHDSTEGNT